MQLTTIPAPTLTAIQALLAPHVPELTPSNLVDALKCYRPDGTIHAERPAPMLSLEEAAAALAVSVCTIRRMVKDGRLPGRKVGKLWRVPVAAVTALAEVGERR